MCRGKQKGGWEVVLDSVEEQNAAVKESKDLPSSILIILIAASFPVFLIVAYAQDGSEGASVRNRIPISETLEGSDLPCAQSHNCHYLSAFRGRRG